MGDDPSPTRSFSESEINTLKATRAPDPVAASPAASGPAGPLFEGQVGAHYLLTMLVEAEARGLPGARIERVEFQRAAEGHPLDDVIIHGSTAEGLTTNLDVQVKRTITLAPSDPVFRDVAEQLGRAISSVDRSHVRQQLAVATERSSAKITGPYKDVLRWARELGSAEIFFERLGRPQVASDDMRTFVETLRKHLKGSGAPGDDETVWQLLRRFNILHFDYAAPGSQSLELALERCRHVLHPNEASKASALWDSLTAKALQAAAAGGERSRADLAEELATAASFRLSGSTRNRHARETLAEAAALASQNLQRTIAGVSLSRAAQIAEVREAAEQGRYVEIRGAAGVGKSGLLSAFLSETLSEGQAIVLTPDRTPAGGWVGFKSDLRIEMSPEAFLSDVASDGGAVLFIDSLDSFSDPGRRATAIDLVQAAAGVPAMTVIVTARSDFDRDTPNWLSADALQELGCAPVVTLNELGTEEIAELKSGAPALKLLLGDNHPAKSVARNLFRLSRLLEAGTSAEEVRSEADLLDRWWKTGDGPADVTLRDRRRLLAALADAALDGHDRVETDAHGSAIDALVATNTILELRLDCVSFAKDTLRDWAVASRLHEDPDRMAGLPFERPAPPSLSRGIELAARLSLERSATGDDWAKFLERVSSESAHGSWRRWSLLAIIRSERAASLLDRASPQLFANGGPLLRELIRTAIAVESRPMAEILADLEGFDPSTAKDLYAPANASWFTLARWLVDRKSNVPLEALPDIIDLFQGLGMATLFMGPLAAMLANPLADWLEEIELARDHSLYGSDDRPRARRLFGYHELLNLSNDLRHAFALMASSVPKQAQRYLREVLNRERSKDIIEDILKFRGTFAKAAPKELADLTLKGLIPDDIGRHRSVRLMRDEPFNHLDHELLPSSPAQGPFLELLNVSPEDGLRVVRALVAHAVAYWADEDPGENQIVIHFESGARAFPWANTYNWSRGNHCLYALESALMALEAWGHQRIERGDLVEDVLADVLGPERSPAAFLLVAVDLILSHWPKALAAAAPFLGSPDLLALDRTRQSHDDTPGIDLLGWGDLGPNEPAGQVNLASINARPSRGACLEQLLPQALFRDEVDDARLRQLLSDASIRLGQPEPGDAFDMPRFMARYALNLLDRTNWQERDDGALEYVTPEAERQHLAAIHTERDPEIAQFGLEAQIQLALEDKSKSKPDLPARAAAHAKQLQLQGGEPEDVLKSRRTKIASAAMIVARDSEDSFLASEESWVRSVFELALSEPNTDAATSMRNGIHYNPVAIAAVGIGELWRRYGKVADRDWLLKLASRPESDAIQGIATCLPVIRSADDRVIRSILRIAFVSQIRPEKQWEGDDSDQVNADRNECYRQAVSKAVAAERAWLDGEAGEPAWPSFPRRKRYLRNAGRSKFVEDDDFEPESDGETFVISQTCARWLHLMTRDESPADIQWLPSLIAECEPWTLYANGAGLDASAEINGHLDEWNSTFFRLFARMLPNVPEADAVDSVRRAVDIPDESFFEVAADLVPSLDALYFNDQGGTLHLLLKLRSVIAERLIATYGWRRERDRDELTAEVHIGPAIAVMFFNHQRAFKGSEAYLKPKGIDRVEPFLSLLERLIVDGPVPLTSLLTMNLLEVAPNASHLGFFLSSALTWLKRQPDNTRFWIDHGLGIRLAKWLDGIITADPPSAASDHPARPMIDDLLARLVRLGVPGAHALEQKLSPLSA